MSRMSGPRRPASLPLSRIPPDAQTGCDEELWVITRSISENGQRDPNTPGSGAMTAKLPDEQKEIPLPLKHTDVKASISGYMATVEVTQQFRNPYDSERAANVIYLRNCSLSTSGNYEKFFKVGAKIYAHILNPTTGKPVENMLAAIILAPCARDADALSTAFYVMGVERSREYLTTHRDLMALFYLPVGRDQRFRRVMLRSAGSNDIGAFFSRTTDRRRSATRAAGEIRRRASHSRMSGNRATAR